MGYSGGVIVNEVGMGDISTALGYASLDLGTLAQYSGQNKWAKCKSFGYPAWYFASSSAEQTARASKNCGLVMKDYGNNWTLYAAMVAGGNGAAAWKHDVPTGGNSAPFRMLDYLGYNTAAVAPFQFGIFPNPAYRRDSIRLSDEGGTSIAEIDISDLNGDETGALNYSGFAYKNIQLLNIGVMYGQSDSYPAAAYTLGPITSWNRLSIQKPSGEAYYYVVPFLTDKTFSGSATSTNGIFIPCPIGMQIWHYLATLGLDYGNTELNAARNYLHMYVGSVSGALTYYKMTVTVKSGSTTLNTIDLNSGQSGTLYTTPTDFGNLSLTNAVPQGATFWMRFWADGQTYYDEQFYPAETPI